LAVAAPALAAEPPTCTKTEPGGGPATGGTTVTITGSNFVGVQSVKFGGEKNAASFTVNSETSITAVSPALLGRESAKAGVTVTTPAGTSPVTLACKFTYAPAVTRVEPGTGSPAGGNTVKIEGLGFQATSLPGEVEHGFWVQQVFFGTTPVLPASVNESYLTVIAPAGTGTVDVTVNTQGGTSPITPADRFTYVEPPTVTKVEPSFGSGAGGTSVTITGTNFTEGSTVKFGSNFASGVKVNSETSITAVSPAGTGTVDVTVMTPSGTSPTSEADRFTYGPTVGKVEPNTGSAAGGTSVTITGSGFTGATAVKFGSNEATSFTVNSESSITAVSPAGTGTVDVTVTTPAGTSSTGSADQFTYGPTVTKVEPNRGSPGGGTTVTITGTGFTGATAVKFGATSAKSFTVNSATSISAVSPKVKGTGTVDVTVTTPAATSPTSGADQFTFSRK
jgi:hypothetical protein